MEVVLDGPRTDEQASRDLGVGEALAGQPRNLALLRSELVTGLDGAFAGGPAGRTQLASGALREGLGTDCGEHLVGGSELFARVREAALTAEPFAVEQMGTGERQADACPAEPVDRLPVEPLGALVLADQRSR